MSTASFERSFVFSSEESVSIISNELVNPKKVKLKKRDYEADKIKGISLLQQRFSKLETR